MLFMLFMGSVLNAVCWEFIWWNNRYLTPSLVIFFTGTQGRKITLFKYKLWTFVPLS